MTSVKDTAQMALNRAMLSRVNLYALLDAAREAQGLYEAKQEGLESESLFAGMMGELLKEVAPYLISFPPRSEFSSWWFEQFGNSIGVLVQAPVSFEELRKHFRTLMMVRGGDQTRYYFRFYDPRVLRVFLPACTSEELDLFFGPIGRFYCEGEGGGELLSFEMDGRKQLVARSWPVAAPVQSRTR